MLTSPGGPDNRQIMLGTNPFQARQVVEGCSGRQASLPTMQPRDPTSVGDSAPFTRRPTIQQTSGGGPPSHVSS
jgi:hypothetical protein